MTSIVTDTRTAKPALLVEEISQGKSFADAAYLYLERDKLADLSGTPLTATPFKLSETQSFQIEARLGAGAEGVVYYGTLIGEGWGKLTGRDAGLKVSHPFSTRYQRTLPGDSVSSNEECRDRLENFRAQSSAMELLRSATDLNGRQIAPEMYGKWTLHLEGRKGVAVEAIAIEFIDGESLTQAIHHFQEGEISDNKIITYLHQSALTLRHILLNGVAFVDANTDNFQVPSRYHADIPFSVFVDYGGAVANSTLTSEEDIGENRAQAIRAFGNECKEISKGPKSELIESAVQILGKLTEMEITLTIACEQLRKLL